MCTSVDDSAVKILASKSPTVCGNNDETLLRANFWDTLYGIGWMNV